jgi:hypothetical protein
MDQEQWVEEVAAKVKSRRQSEESSNQKAESEAERKKSTAPQLWEQTKKAFKSHTERLIESLGQPAELVWTTEGSNQPRVRIAAAKAELGKQVAMNYDPETLTLTCVGTRNEKKYAVDIIDGQVVFASNMGVGTSQDELAQGLLAEMLASSTEVRELSLLSSLGSGRTGYTRQGSVESSPRNCFIFEDLRNASPGSRIQSS